MHDEAQYDVVVIGGAVMGCAAAYWLTRLSPGLRVLVVEQDPSYARSSTALSVASVRQQFTTEVNVKISLFGIDFIRNFQDYLAPVAKVAPLGLRENGYLFLCADPAPEAAMRAAQAMQVRLGAQTELLEPAAIAARFPWLEVGDLQLASYGPAMEGWFDNMGLLAGFRTAARAQGAEFRTGRVAGLEADAGKVGAVLLADGARISCGSVINAAGTQAAEILSHLNENLPVEPRKRTVFLIDAPDANHPDAPLMICHSGFYLRPEQGHWLCADIPQDDHAADPDDFDPDLMTFEEVIWPRLYARAPEFAAVKVLRAWAGHYAYNRLDQNAIVGAHPNWRNLFLMNGFSGHGLQQAPAIGRGIAELIVHGQYRTLNLSALGVARILEGRAFREAAIV